MIDQSAVNNTNVKMCHTYFSNANLQGYGFVSSTASASEGNRTFCGCNGSAGNGIPCGEAVLFCAPLEQGSGTPNTIYSGNDSFTNPTTIVAGTTGSLAETKVGSGSGGVTSQDGGISCGATCTASYVNSSKLVLTATAVGGSVFTGWSGACSGIGSCAVTINGATKVNAMLTLAPLITRILDIDANALYRPESDGVIILRYLFGCTESALTANALGARATCTGEPQTTTYLIDILPLLDADGNGRVQASSDELMIVRKLLGLTGTTITHGAMGVGATRPPVDFDAYIQALKPP